MKVKNIKLLLVLRNHTKNFPKPIERKPKSEKSFLETMLLTRV